MSWTCDGLALVTTVAFVAVGTACATDDGASLHLDAATADSGAAADSGATADAEAPADAEATADSGVAADSGATADAGRPTAGSCFADVYAEGSARDPGYDRFDLTVGSHCAGTDHQAITGVERVVFLGDSITVGTPPATWTEYYRSKLADALARRFSLAGPRDGWKYVNVFSGTALSAESGAFASCAKWGARAEDLPGQLDTCFPEERRDERTLIVMTAGGNDLGAIAEAGATMSRTIDELWTDTRDFVARLRAALDWITTPGRFPNGVYVVFGNIYEYTDGTADLAACPAARHQAHGTPWSDPDALVRMAAWANGELARHAAETGTDMVFMLEHFCGHGFAHDDPSSPCYRGPGTERWFDGTCIHPNSIGHDRLARMFLSVVDE